MFNILSMLLAKINDDAKCGQNVIFQNCPFQSSVSNIVKVWYWRTNFQTTDQLQLVYIGPLEQTTKICNFNLLLVWGLVVASTDTVVSSSAHNWELGLGRRCIKPKTGRVILPTVTMFIEARNRILQCCQTRATHRAVAQDTKDESEYQRASDRCLIHNMIWFALHDTVHHLSDQMVTKNSSVCECMHGHTHTRTHHRLLWRIFGVSVTSTADWIVPQKDDHLHRLHQSSLAHNASTHPVVTAGHVCMCVRVHGWAGVHACGLVC